MMIDRYYVLLRDFNMIYLMMLLKNYFSMKSLPYLIIQIAWDLELEDQKYIVNCQKIF